jgi:hypothetical protein
VVAKAKEPKKNPSSTLGLPAESTPKARVNVVSPTEPQAKSPSLAQAPALQAVASNQSQVESLTPSQEQVAPSRKTKGYVYRAFMDLKNLEVIAPKIADMIRSMGGEKAGEVELGWRRGTGRYFHFSLPESNEKKIIEQLQVFGPVRISKDPHPRVMPEGQVRFILWIEAVN